MTNPMTVRLVTDHETLKIWIEEKVGLVWVVIIRTVMNSEGAAWGQLEEEIKARKNQVKTNRTYGVPTKVNV